MDLTVRQKLCDYDENIYKSAKGLLRQSKLKQVQINPISGMVTVQLKNGKFETIKDKKEMDDLTEKCQNSASASTFELSPMDTKDF